MKQWKVFLLWLFVLVIGIGNGKAQVSYDVEVFTSSGNPGGLNSESDISTTGWSTIMNGGIMTNQWSAPVAIPFNFDFFGQQKSSFRVSANGLLTFTTNPGTPPSNNESLPSSLLPDNTIACFWESFTHSPPVSFSDLVDTKVFGSAPYRQFWVRWYSFEWGPINFAYLAIVLEETTNKIYVVDMYESFNSNLVSSTVGVQSNSSFALQSGSSSTPLANGGSGNLDNSYHSFTPFSIQMFDVEPVAITSPQGTGCGLGVETVTVRVANVGLMNANNATARLIVDGGAPSFPETIFGTILPNDTIDFTFAAPADLSAIGPHTLSVVVTVAGDGDQTNDTLTVSLNSLMEINTFPHVEDFESGASGWQAGGTNSSWSLGPPFNNTIKGAASGINSWVTNLAGNYNDNEQSWVQSPCYNLSTLGAGAVLSFNIWWETENDWDGAVLQASVDDGANWANIGAYNDPYNWFNDFDIHAGPGGQTSGWTGGTFNKGSKGWVRAQHEIPPSLIGMSNVYFRIAFASDNSQNTDGVAFDDFAMGVPPSVDLGSNGFYCNGAVLDAGHPGKSVVWSTGATSQTITLSNPGSSAILDSMIIVTVTDNVGLITKDTILVSIAEPVEVAVDLVTHVACFGDSTGALQISPVGGSAPYFYQWNTGSIFEDQFNLPAGDYTVTVTDFNNCTAILDTIEITENPLLKITEEVTEVGCFGGASGAIELTVDGGAGGYVYDWDTGDNGSSLQNIPVGVYQVAVSDMAGCSDTLSFLITQPDTIPDAGFGFDFAGSGVGFSDSSRGAATYFWDFGDSTGTSTKANPAYLYNKNGVYEVMQIVTNDCGSDTSIQTVNIETVDIDFLIPDPSIDIYPNPSNGNFELVFDQVVPGKYTLEIFNIGGQVIYQEDIGRIQTGHRRSVSIHPVPPVGIYFLRLESDQTILYSKIAIE